MCGMWDTFTVFSVYNELKYSKESRKLSSTQANGPCNHVARHVRHVGYLHSVFSIERTQILQGVTEIIVNTYVNITQKHASNYKFQNYKF